MKEETAGYKLELKKLRATKDIDFEKVTNKIKKEKIDIQKALEEYKS